MTGLSNMILTVTLNPALDRTMTVPNFQAGMRHRATDTVILPGGKGINVARAVKALGRPVIATGFVGGRKGDQIVADLNGEGILCDFVRVAGESRISTAVVDPATNAITEINEQGPEIQPEELESLYDKLDYLGRAAEIVVFAGSVPPGLDDDCYAQMIQKLRPLGVKVVLLHLRRAAAPGHQGRARLRLPEAGRGREGHRLRVHQHGGPHLGRAAHARDGRRARWSSPSASAASPSWTIGRALPHVHRQDARSGRALAAGLGRRARGRVRGQAHGRGAAPRSACASVLGCAAANLVRYGAGVFSPADAERLAKRVELEEVPAE